VPDAWPRFERFIRNIAKAGPQHRTKDKARLSSAKHRQDKDRKGDRKKNP
jgi:hypothetical protein